MPYAKVTQQKPLTKRQALTLKDFYKSKPQLAMNAKDMELFNAHSEMEVDGYASTAQIAAAIATSWPVNVPPPTNANIARRLNGLARRGLLHAAGESLWDGTMDWVLTAKGIKEAKVYKRYTRPVTLSGDFINATDYAYKNLTTSSSNIHTIGTASYQPTKFDYLANAKFNFLQRP